MSDTAAVNLRHKWRLSLADRGCRASRTPPVMTAATTTRCPAGPVARRVSRRRFPICGTPRRAPRRAARSSKQLARSMAHFDRDSAAVSPPALLLASFSHGRRHAWRLVAAPAGQRRATSVSAHRGSVSARAPRRMTRGRPAHRPSARSSRPPSSRAAAAVDAHRAIPRRPAPSSRAARTVDVDALRPRRPAPSSRSASAVDVDALRPRRPAPSSRAARAVDVDVDALRPRRRAPSSRSAGAACSFSPSGSRRRCPWRGGEWRGGPRRRSIAAGHQRTFDRIRDHEVFASIQLRSRHAR
jgi:hypothetical protein